MKILAQLIPTVRCLSSAFFMTFAMWLFMYLCRVIRASRVAPSWSAWFPWDPLAPPTKATSLASAEWGSDVPLRYREFRSCFIFSDCGWMWIVNELYLSIDYKQQSRCIPSKLQLQYHGLAVHPPSSRAASADLFYTAPSLGYAVRQNKNIARKCKSWTASTAVTNDKSGIIIELFK